MYWEKHMVVFRYTVKFFSGENGPIVFVFNKDMVCWLVKRTYKEEKSLSHGKLSLSTFPLPVLPLLLSTPLQKS